MPSGTSALTAVNPIADSSANAASSTSWVRPALAQYWIGLTASRLMSMPFMSDATGRPVRADS